MHDCLKMHSCDPHSYAVRVIGSQLAPSVSIDEHAVMQGILQDLELQGKAEASSRLVRSCSKHPPAMLTKGRT